jgi:hypothetical protein
LTLQIEAIPGMMTVVFDLEGDVAILAKSSDFFLKAQVDVQTTCVPSFVSLAAFIGDQITAARRAAVRNGTPFTHVNRLPR